MKPAIGQVWRDLYPFDPGHERLVRVTSVGETESGTQVRVMSWSETLDGTPISEPKAGVMHTDWLHRYFEYERTEEDS